MVYLMYYNRDSMKRKTPNDMNAVRRVSIYFVYYTETTLKITEGIAGTTPVADTAFNRI